MDEALVRFQRDVSIVTDAAGTHHDAALQITLRALSSQALLRATLAFRNAGDPLNPAWRELVTAIAQFLNCRDNFPQGDDGPERARLRLFVHDNVDVLPHISVAVRL